MDSFHCDSFLSSGGLTSRSKLTGMAARFNIGSTALFHGDCCCEGAPWGQPHGYVWWRDWPGTFCLVASLDFGCYLGLVKREGFLFLPASCVFRCAEFC